MFRTISVHVLLCILGQSSTLLIHDLTSEFQRTHIFADFFIKLNPIPEDVEPCRVTYPNATVDMGNQLHSKETNYTPIVQWTAHQEKLYSLFLFDLDAPSQRVRHLSPYMQWMVANIPGPNVTAGDTVFQYASPCCPPGSGLHRSLFLIYGQISKTHYRDEEALASVGFRGPMEFDTIVHKYHLHGPIALNYFILS